MKCSKNFFKFEFQVQTFFLQSMSFLNLVLRPLARDESGEIFPHQPEFQDKQVARIQLLKILMSLLSMQHFSKCQMISMMALKSTVALWSKQNLKIANGKKPDQLLKN